VSNHVTEIDLSSQDKSARLIIVSYSNWTSRQYYYSSTGLAQVAQIVDSGSGALEVGNSCILVNMTGYRAFPCLSTYGGHQTRSLTHSAVQCIGILGL
jgi:hypothetical protein